MLQETMAHARALFLHYYFLSMEQYVAFLRKYKTRSTEKHDIFTQNRYNRNIRFLMTKELYNISE